MNSLKTLSLGSLYLYVGTFLVQSLAFPATERFSWFRLRCRTFLLFQSTLDASRPASQSWRRTTAGIQARRYDILRQSMNITDETKRKIALAKNVAQRRRLAKKEQRPQPKPAKPSGTA